MSDLRGRNRTEAFGTQFETVESIRHREEAETEIFNAISEGRCYISNHRVGDGRHFRFWAEGEEEKFFMGSRIPMRQEITLRVQSPLTGEIYLLRNGQGIKKLKGKALSHRTKESGVYRIEVFRKKRGWIYTNPIVITIPDEV